MNRVLTEQQVRRALDGLYAAILSELPSQGPVAVVGIRTRGETLAQRVVERLRVDRSDLQIEHAVLDITFYRDDLSRRRGVPMVRATEIDFDLDDAWVLLIDDVLQTGRSVRAALDALHDFGRPRVVRLAVLIDRGGREVPVSADFIGRKVGAKPDQLVQLRPKENDDEEGVFLIPKAS